MRGADWGDHLNGGDKHGRHHESGGIEVSSLCRLFLPFRSTSAITPAALYSLQPMDYRIPPPLPHQIQQKTSTLARAGHEETAGVTRSQSGHPCLRRGMMGFMGDTTGTNVEGNLLPGRSNSTSLVHSNLHEIETPYIHAWRSKAWQKGWK